MLAAQVRSFGQLIRERRRQLNFSQQELSRRIGVSTAHIGHLELGNRHPSDKLVARLAQVLGIDGRESFLLTHPRAQELFIPQSSQDGPSAWEEFRHDEQLRRLHGITNEEMEMLSRVALLGEVSSPRDFIHILNTVRYAVRR